ncbi:tyrosine-type recombinase/integrase [Nonomuraea sp. NPDC059023]|uniref:tyrosine-type recombinase/integrase n=1 Tax=unclassified Nonomuraea TaxID=2593643 RepID=UPI0036C1A996
MPDGRSRTRPGPRQHLPGDPGGGRGHSRPHGRRLRAERGDPAGADRRGARLHPARVRGGHGRVHRLGCKPYSATLPATAETVAEYVRHLTVTPTERRGTARSPAGIERALAAIRTTHRLAGRTPPETKAARTLLTAYRARLALAKDPAARSRKATPALPGALRAMLATRDRTSLTGQRDAALFLLGYATAARAGELVALDIADLAETAEGLTVTVYRPKLKKFTEVAVPYGSNPATCPVRAARAYLATLATLATHGRSTGPLFVRIAKGGHLARPMTRHGKPIGDPHGRLTAEAITDIVGATAKAAELTGTWTGHSLRRGFATAARRAGADLERIGRHGGWADNSTALLGYIEEADRWTDNPVTGL